MYKKLMFLISFVLVLVFASSLTQAAVQIWREAESADPLTAPMVKSTDDPNASAGAYIGVTLGNNSTAASPAPNGTASYIFDVPAAGTYQVIVRLRCATDTVDDDSSYARIDGATLNTTTGLVGGWIKWNNISARVNGTSWQWVKVFNNGDSDKDVEFTLAAGQYVLEIAYREDGMYFDGILITDDLALDISTLPAALPGCVEANKLVNGGFEDGFGAPWVLDNATPATEIVDDAQSGANALKITVAAKGSSDYIPALAQPGFGFEAGKKYTFSVFMKGQVDGMKVQLKPQQRGGSYTGYGQKTVTLTTEWAEYSTTTPVFSSAIATADVSIWLGMQAGTIYIDHVRFYEGDYVAPCPPVVPPVVLKATKPNPPSGTTGLTRFNMLSWKPGNSADSHNVYLGTNQQAVTDANVGNPMGVLVSQQQVNAFYDAAGDYGKTYYWRIDEVDEADMTITKGSVWNFSTKPIGLTVPKANIIVTASSSKANQGPEKTIDGSGITGDLHENTGTNMWLSDVTTDPNKAWIRYDFNQVYKMPIMLIWNYNQTGIFANYAIKGCVIEYSADAGTTWTALDVNELPKGNGASLSPLVVDLGGVADGLAINSIRITANNNFSTSFKNYGLSEVRFYYVPVRPTNPSPADDATGIVVGPKLTWTPGEGVVEHKVYFGTNEQDVNDGTAASYVVATPSFTPPVLTLGVTYFWRVEEVNMASLPTEWSGNTWSFSTSAYTVVDDFESYATAISNWSNGSSTNGATISLDTALANNGSKSLNFLFNNINLTNNLYYSQTSVTPSQLTSGSDWTKGGAKWLVFWVYGDIANPKTEKLYVVINNAYYWNQQDLIPDSEIVSPSWTQVQVPLIANQVTLNNVTSLKIGFTRDDATAGAGKVHIDDVRLYKDLPVPIVPVNPGDANMVARYRMENNVNDSSSNHINGTIIGNPQFVSNEYTGYGKALAFDANQDCVDLGNNDAFNFKGSFSISFWANIQAWTTSWGNVMIGNRGESNLGWQIRQGTSNYLSFTTRGVSNDDMFSNLIPPQNKWVHITCVYDSVAFTKAIYFDGKLIRKIALTGTTRVVAATTHNTYLGARANSGNTGQESLFKGKLDEVRIYNKVLSDAEIKYLSDPTP